jgi:hypothetical protein
VLVHILTTEEGYPIEGQTVLRLVPLAELQLFSAIYRINFPKVPWDV